MTEEESREDTISRAAALDAIFGCFNVMESKGIDMTIAKTIVKSVLDEAPTIPAIPVEWLMDLANRGNFVDNAVARWKYEQEKLKHKQEVQNG